MRLSCHFEVKNSYMNSPVNTIFPNQQCTLMMQRVISVLSAWSGGVCLRGKHPEVNACQPRNSPLVLLLTTLREAGRGSALTAESTGGPRSHATEAARVMMAMMARGLRAAGEGLEAGRGALLELLALGVA